MTGVRGGDQGVDCSQSGSVRRDCRAGTPRTTCATAASLAVTAGGNVKAVQRVSGHASAAMTLDVYAGLFGDEFDSMADRLDGIPADCVPD